LPPVGMVPAGGLGRPELLQDGENPLPQVVGHLPDRGQGLDLLRSFALALMQGCHHGGALLGDSLLLFYLLALQGRSPCSRIVSSGERKVVGLARRRRAVRDRQKAARAAV